MYNYAVFIYLDTARAMRNNSLGLVPYFPPIFCFRVNILIVTFRKTVQLKQNNTPNQILTYYLLFSSLQDIPGTHYRNTRCRFSNTLVSHWSVLSHVFNTVTGNSSVPLWNQISSRSNVRLEYPITLNWCHIWSDLWFEKILLKPNQNNTWFFEDNVGIIQ